MAHDGEHGGVPVSDLAGRLFRHITELETQIRAYGKRIDEHAATRESPQLQALDAHLKELDSEIRIFAGRTDELLTADLYVDLRPIDEKNALFGNRVEDYSNDAKATWARIGSANIGHEDMLDLLDTRGDVETRIGMLVREHHSLVEGKKNMQFNVLTRQEDSIKSKEAVLDAYEELVEVRHELSMAPIRAHKEMLMSKCELLRCLVDLMKSFKELC